ncbi:hypothetical protein E2562_037629 [Oryza meyeriana var. granulata]|uniref:Uncharacterized protein n=1 Tax=Oryza meyeriana var. granulata TaxID=110450 RepID=A0A6G1FGB8_9ORYZ|nr:hypothetical protein E2562_037629 [Oryza meyeriana var. granulata]
MVNPSSNRVAKIGTYPVHLPVGSNPVLPWPSGLHASPQEEAPRSSAYGVPQRFGRRRQHRQGIQRHFKQGHSHQPLVYLSRHLARLHNKLPTSGR